MIFFKKAQEVPPQDECEWCVDGIPQYYPFAVNVNIVPSQAILDHYSEGDLNVTLFDYLPDLWSKEFGMLAYRRAYLMCADESQVNFSEDVSEDDYPFPTNEHSEIIFPARWQQHKAQALCNETALLCYFLGNDLHFFWKKYGQEEGGMTEWPRLWWLRKLIVDMPGGESTPAKRAFAELMKEEYYNSTALWNDAYPDFQITCFLKEEAEEGSVCLETAFGHDFEGNEGNLYGLLNNPDDHNDLGWNLTLDDRKVFIEAMADTFFSLAASAIHEFDPHHLIASTRLQYIMRGQFKPIVRKASRYCDVISLHRYAWTDWPDPDPGDDYVSVDESLDEVIELYEDLKSDAQYRTIPFFIDEFCFQANWEKGYEACCGRGEYGDNTVEPCDDCGPCPERDPEDDGPLKP